LIVHFLDQTKNEKKEGLRNNLVISSPKKRDNLFIAEHIRNLYHSDPEIKEIIDLNSNTDLLRPRMKSLEPTQRLDILKGLIPLGVGVHDADMSQSERQIVGRAFRDRELCILIASQTMAYGVNLPAQTIVFLGWGTRPPSASHNIENQHGQFIEGLESDFVTWLGRVGRFGQRSHRDARALYLCGGTKGSDEHNRITNRIAAPDSPINPMLHQDLKAE
jgi:superfamily II RNA helicase